MTSTTAVDTWRHEQCQQILGIEPESICPIPSGPWQKQPRPPSVNILPHPTAESSCPSPLRQRPLSLAPPCPSSSPLLPSSSFERNDGVCRQRLKDMPLAQLLLQQQQRYYYHKTLQAEAQSVQGPVGHNQGHPLKKALDPETACCYLQNDKESLFCDSPASPFFLFNATTSSSSSSSRRSRSSYWDDNSSTCSSSPTSPRHGPPQSSPLHQEASSPASSLANGRIAPTSPDGGAPPGPKLHQRHQHKHLQEGKSATSVGEDSVEEEFALCLNFEEAEAECRKLDMQSKLVDGITILPMQACLGDAESAEAVLYALQVQGKEGLQVPGDDSLHLLLPPNFNTSRRQEAKAPASAWQNNKSCDSTLDEAQLLVDILP